MDRRDAAIVVAGKLGHCFPAAYRSASFRRSPPSSTLGRPKRVPFSPWRAYFLRRTAAGSACAHDAAGDFRVSGVDEIRRLSVRLNASTIKPCVLKVFDFVGQFTPASHEFQVSFLYTRFLHFLSGDLAFHRFYSEQFRS
jgi:hypothetical protein